MLPQMKKSICTIATVFAASIASYSQNQRATPNNGLLNELYAYYKLDEASGDAVDALGTVLTYRTLGKQSAQLPARSTVAGYGTAVVLPCSASLIQPSSRLERSTFHFLYGLILLTWCRAAATLAYWLRQEQQPIGNTFSIFACRQANGRCYAPSTTLIGH